jgi:hypothetical protein
MYKQHVLLYARNMCTKESFGGRIVRVGAPRPIQQGIMFTHNAWVHSRNMYTTALFGLAALRQHVHETYVAERSSLVYRNIVLSQNTRQIFKAFRQMSKASDMRCSDM